MTTKAAPRAPKTVNGTYLENRRLWTVGEFERAADLGAFGSDEKLELIEGEIIRKMTQREPHTTSLHLTLEILRAVYAGGYYLRGQSPLVFAPRSRPEPDIAVVPGSIRDYQGQHPTTALLVVEISDTTLLMDQTAKAAVYARAGIPEYWIVNLPGAPDRSLPPARPDADPAARPRIPKPDPPPGRGDRRAAGFPGRGDPGLKSAALSAPVRLKNDRVLAENDGMQPAHPHPLISHAKTGAGSDASRPVGTPVSGRSARLSCNPARHSIRAPAPAFTPPSSGTSA